jgi:Ca2+/Na+ antiporter
LTYGDQFRACLAPEIEEGETPSAGDWFGHIVSLPFKVLFATIPPPHIMGGKACFCIALAYIGLVTAFIGDIAGLFGCVLDLDDSVTAITFVALGTSLPDTFASKAAAVAEETADSAVGNVTGSNSVNVFLGLGLPWMIAAIAWSKDASQEEMLKWSAKYPHLVKDYPTGAFAVPAGALGFSVTVFSVCAITTLATLVLRRKMVGAELGGDPKIARNTSMFMWSLWFIYVLLSSLQAYGHIG